MNQSSTLVLGCVACLGVLTSGCFAQGSKQDLGFRRAAIHALREAATLRERASFSNRPPFVDKVAYERFLAREHESVDEYLRDVASLPPPESKQDRFLAAGLATFGQIAAQAENKNEVFADGILALQAMTSTERSGFAPSLKSEEEEAREREAALGSYIDRLAATEVVTQGTTVLRDYLMAQARGDAFTADPRGWSQDGTTATLEGTAVDGFKDLVSGDLARFK